AMILSDGNVKYKDIIGSIHRVGTIIQNAPCNGWEHWYYKDNNGNLVVIDELRKIMRKKAYSNSEENNNDNST
ncbi:MAG: hypothetical protein NTV38_05000, partial [Chloroflexi bacterium]|nr:hypothetical protein [Chloroflexota bacterium]